MKYALAGDRKISVQILEWLIKKGNMPLALFLSEGKNETHGNELTMEKNGGLIIRIKKNI